MAPFETQRPQISSVSLEFACVGLDQDRVCIGSDRRSELHAAAADRTTWESPRREGCAGFKLERSPEFRSQQATSIGHDVKCAKPRRSAFVHEHPIARANRHTSRILGSTRNRGSKSPERVREPPQSGVRMFDPSANRFLPPRSIANSMCTDFPNASK